MKPQPQFLTIRWEDTPEQGSVVTLEAMACLRHRREIALAYPSARGAGGRGEDCDLCSGRHPQSLGSTLSQSHRSQLGSPDGKPGASGRPRRPAPSNKSGIGALLQGAPADCGTQVTMARDSSASHADVNAVLMA
ncbi:MAG: hypothetical protein QOJ93_1060 [Actinomycetota bacterium]|jgi:hypothetical protein|nr:hypothetical protein [Actinomycetota bacterium]